METGAQEGGRSFSFRHLYGRVRRRLWGALDRVDGWIERLRERRIAGLNWAVLTMAAALKTALLPVRLALSVIDLVARWLVNILDAIVGDRGWLTVGSVIGGYLVIYGLMDAKHQRDENQASLQLSTFVTLVSSGNPASFVVALKTFGPVQTMKATSEPSLFEPWTWNRKIMPNRSFMQKWAQSQFRLCEPGVCSLDKDRKVRIDLSGADLSFANLSFADLRDAYLSTADLRGADLSEADLRGADLRFADLRGADLSRAKLRGADLRGADLRDVDLRGADLNGVDLSEADLRGADLRGADLSRAKLRGAYLSGADLIGANVKDAQYTQDTKFPDGFDPIKAGMNLAPP